MIYIYKALEYNICQTVWWDGIRKSNSNAISHDDNKSFELSAVLQNQKLEECTLIGLWLKQKSFEK